MQLGFAAALPVLLAGLIHSRVAPTADPLAGVGELLAEQIALLVVESMVSGDRIYPGVLAERVAADEQVAAVVIQTVDGEALAAYGNVEGSAGTVHVHEIQVADSVAGYVRVVLLPQAPAPVWWRFWPWLLAAALAAALFGWLAQRTGNPRSRRPPDKPESAGEPARRPVTLLVANLHLPLNAADETARMQARVAGVAQLYNAAWQTLAGTGFVLLFDGNNGERLFEAACAGLVLCGLSNDPDSPGVRLRCALNVAVSAPTGDDHHSIDAEAQADAVLLSAVADDASIAVPASVGRILSQGDRLLLSREHNAALRSLHNGEDTDFYLLRRAAEPIDSLIRQQVASLSQRSG